MSTTEQRLGANRSNALKSTGPVTMEGKTIASLNATRHGFLSARLFLDGEEPSDFQALFEDLSTSLAPVGTLEAILIERMAVTIWRQRRLTQAETASLSLSRQSKQIARGVAAELGRGNHTEVKQDELEPFDGERVQWCTRAVAEIEDLEHFDLAVLETNAPTVFEQLKSDAEEDDEPLVKFVTDHENGLTGYIVKLLQWCREQLATANARPHILALAEQVKAKRLVLPADALELLARYQTTLDNQLYKSIRALREAQEWRLKTLQPASEPATAQVAEVADAA